MSLVETAASAGGAFDSIPIIDLGCASTHEERAALARQIRYACSLSNEPFAVKNHGIPDETIDKIFSAMKAFFSLPVEEKMKLHHRQGAHYRGFEPLLDSNINAANRGDLYEGFVIGWEDLVPKDVDEEKADKSTLVFPNLWPSELPGFRETFINYYHAAFGVGRDLHRLFAVALDLPETYFDDKLKRYPIMRGLHYPPQTGPEDDGIIGIGAHSDFECFTVLWQEPGIQALQILNSENQWINATPIPGTLVINIGDLLSRWTNDIFRSTMHRAINRSGVRRYSIPMFIGANPHVEVEPLPTCVSPERPAKYGTVTSGEYVQKRIHETYQRSLTTSNGMTKA
ncbi:hypothetical protein EDD16DRAFT_1704233 [Pisolithus croceorrhizus]|nr:hypothetical protein EV401DRAFT_2077352 [Pisolithus croceorrhizus]KAI6123626.1 hypothetical protein EDD16DRAFT_1704233 [Pisolithus croceorrhizus]KAI6156058.1 hypothetical protein EDD17DRAFT_1764691 [Pisolithus thermaeus]